MNVCLCMGFLNPSPSDAATDSLYSRKREARPADLAKSEGSTHAEDLLLLREDLAAAAAEGAEGLLACLPFFFLPVPASVL